MNSTRVFAARHNVHLPLHIVFNEPIATLGLIQLRDIGHGLRKIGGTI